MHVSNRNRWLNSQPQSEWYSMYLLGMVCTKTAVICRQPDPTKAEPLWKNRQRRRGGGWRGGGVGAFGQYAQRQCNKRALINLRAKVTLK